MKRPIHTHPVLSVRWAIPEAEYVRPIIAALGLAFASIGIAAPDNPLTSQSKITFADSRQLYGGHAYRFAGDGTIEIKIRAESPGGFLAFHWGSKNDLRSATVHINGEILHLSAGGYDGFRWLSIPVPSNISGSLYDIRITNGPVGKPAFLAGVRALAADEAAKMPRLTVVEPAFSKMREIWDREPPEPIADARFRAAEKNGRLAAEAFFRCRKFIDGWLAHADPKTGLIPRNLGDSPYWNGRDSAADNYPFMVLTAAMTDKPLLDGRLTEMLRAEIRLTCRIDRLPDDWSFPKQTWRRETIDPDAVIFDAAEYVKDGLIPITEWLGKSPWSERAVGIVDDIWKHASIETPSGRIPTQNFEVNGDLLQACSRLFWFTGDRKYLDWAIRLGDYYLLGDRHPTRDPGELNLGDHSCEVINGLSELYVACASAAPLKREAYRIPLRQLYDRILEIGRNEHGMIYLTINPVAGTHGTELTDNWGYNYDGIHTVYQTDGVTAYRDAVLKTLGNLKAHYSGRAGLCQNNSADGYADSIEGAINLLNREPVGSAFDWVDSEIRVMWAKQKADGVIEGWHGDGNFARTSLMYALLKTQGCRLEPWRPDLRIGAVRDGANVCLCIAADQPWQGRLVFDQPRHRTHMRLPFDYPRINQFPEWFTVGPGEPLEMEMDGEQPVRIARPETGVELSLRSHQTVRALIRPTSKGTGSPPHP